jgi:hypothetical protein
MISGDNQVQMPRPVPARDPSARSRAVRERDAAIARIRGVRTRAIVGAVGFSLLFAALAQALAPGRNVNAGAIQGPAAPPSSAPFQAGSPPSAPPVVTGGS